MTFTQTYKEAFRIALAITICVIAYHYLRIERGYWALITVFITYSVPMTGLALRKAKDRVLGTILGLIAAFFYANFFLIYDYRYAYALILFTIPAFFYATVKDYYVVGAFFITIIVVTIINSFIPENANLNELLAVRLFYTLLGITIVVLCEMFVFPKTTQVGKAIDDIAKQLCDEFIQVMEDSLAAINKQSVDVSKTLELYEKLINHYTSVRDMYYAQVYELRYDQSQNKVYQTFFETIDAFIPLMARHVGFIRHFSQEIISPEGKQLVEDKTKYVIACLKRFEQTYQQLEFIHPRKEYHYDRELYSEYSVGTNLILSSLDRMTLVVE